MKHLFSVDEPMAKIWDPSAIETYPMPIRMTLVFISVIEWCLELVTDFDAMAS
jgi:hypothetical protein